MSVTLTPICADPVVAILRAGPEHSRYGDPFEVVATVLIRGHVAHLSGMLGQWRREYRREAVRLIHGLGARSMEWERIGDGRTRPKRFMTGRA
ncbi:hypothetical protein [Pseudodesulfovibrio karagichevae]|uniref:Uncharacterized protein n=1 Tax=Pseudodesulfovibrio karagichevae TaxID=3239305 RepID=A0ABV4JXE9_9BACT